jgi:hypothetical protein
MEFPLFERNHIPKMDHEKERRDAITNAVFLLYIYQNNVS